MSSVPQDNRYAPPAAHVEDVGNEGALELAGRGTRLGAALIDVAIAMLAVWIVTLVTPWSPWDESDTLFATTAAHAAFGYVLFIAIQGYFLATRSQTVGKMLLDIRIVRSDGTRASFGRLVGLRYGVGALVSMFPWIGQLYSLVDVLLIFRESRKCLHDNIADTIVVKG
ncbi:RDD family protein [Piscinibacter sp.]|uniref:RDD family protein n=1 Tax=Piscinibacter sp. TaxID=1903157 RepID=UPI002C07ABEC|nr:RDD family protein [Albitalea sp.]HUG24103.1 RDD family protein [Albitalea sp.]